MSTSESATTTTTEAPALPKRPQWKDTPITKEDNPGGLLEESSFATLFPKYREKYLQDSWPEVTRTLKDKLGVRCELDLVEGSMTVRTTKKTYDPYAILKARDIIKMLSRGVPVKQALRGADDDVFCDVIKISGYVQNKEKFVRRRQRLVGPNGATLKAIELLTGCYVLVQGKTVSVMGPYKGLRIVKQIVEDCMNNIHPVYNIKTYMIKKELEKDPTIVGEDYDRFIPKFKKNVVKPKQKKPKKEKKKKVYTPFPPPMPLSKIDQQVESGEYFLSKQAKEASKAAARAEQQKAAALKRKMEKAKSFIPPKEPTAQPKKAEAKEESVEDLKKRVIEQSKAAAKRAAEKSRDAESYIIPAKKAKKN